MYIYKTSPAVDMCDFGLHNEMDNGYLRLVYLAVSQEDLPTLTAQVPPSVDIRTIVRIPAFNTMVDSSQGRSL